MTRTAYFLGKRIDYVLRVAAYEPLRLLDMVSVAGPMPMHVTYTFTPHAPGTLARIRVRGDAGGHYRLAAPIMARKVRSSLGKDLHDLERRLKPPRRPPIRPGAAGRRVVDQRAASSLAARSGAVRGPGP